MDYFMIFKSKKYLDCYFTFKNKKILFKFNKKLKIRYKLI